MALSDHYHCILPDVYHLLKWLESEIETNSNPISKLLEQGKIFDYPRIHTWLLHGRGRQHTPLHCSALAETEEGEAEKVGSRWERADMSIIYHRGAALLSSSSSSFCNNCPKSKPTKPYLSLSFFASSAVKALSIMSSYDRELSAAKKAASLASRLCQVSPKPTHPHPNPTAPPHPPPHPPPTTKQSDFSRTKGKICCVYIQLGFVQLSQLDNLLRYL